MLFSHYDAIYITEDKKTIRTGKFKHSASKGYYLENVDIEEENNEIKIHGYLRKFTLHCDDYDDMFPYPNIMKENYKNYCIKKEDFYKVKVKGWFKKPKTVKRLSRGWYMRKKTTEICFCFHRTDIVEEYCE